MEKERVRRHCSCAFRCGRPARFAESTITAELGVDVGDASDRRASQIASATAAASAFASSSSRHPKGVRLTEARRPEPMDPDSAANLRPLTASPIANRQEIPTNRGPGHSASSNLGIRTVGVWHVTSYRLATVWVASACGSADREGVGSLPRVLAPWRCRPGSVLGRAVPECVSVWRCRRCYRAACHPLYGLVRAGQPSRTHGGFVRPCLPGRR